MVSDWLRSHRRTASGAPDGGRDSGCASRCISTRRGARCLRTRRVVKFDQRTTRQLIQAIADTVIGSAGELTELDRAIGDADHGVNLERGFKAVLAKIDAISARPIN